MDLARVLAHARSIEPTDPDARYCFSLVLKALEHHWLYPEDLGELATALQRPDFGGLGFEELSIEPDWGNDERLRVRFLSETVTCPRESFSRTIEKLCEVTRDRSAVWHKMAILGDSIGAARSVFSALLQLGDEPLKGRGRLALAGDRVDLGIVETVGGRGRVLIASTEKAPYLDETIAWLVEKADLVVFGDLHHDRLDYIERIKKAGATKLEIVEAGPGPNIADEIVRQHAIAVARTCRAALDTWLPGSKRRLDQTPADVPYFPIWPAGLAERVTGHGPDQGPLPNTPLA